MGGLFTSLKKLFSKTKEMRVLMIGLDNAGKTSIVNAMQTEKLAPGAIKPTIGFNLQEVSIGNFKLKVWDISGQEKCRELWRHYYEGARGIIFVVDCADKGRAVEARDEFQKLLLDPDLTHARILVFANKQDLSDAMKAKDIKDKFGIGFDVASRVKVQEASAKTQYGLLDGFTWLVSEIEKAEAASTA